MAFRAASKAAQQLPPPKKLAELRDEQVERARVDPNAFIEFALEDEDGKAFRQGHHHVEWQRLWTEHDAVALLGFAEAGKSMQVAFRILHLLGNNPELRCTLVGASDSGPKKTLGIIKRQIESNPRVARVFPALRPGKTWKSNELVVAGRKATTTKDPSVQAFGWDSKFLGIRSDVLVADDINDDKNSRSPEVRAQIVKTFDEKVQSRVTARGRVWVIGNAWHRDDLVHTLGRRDGFVFRRYGVLRDDGMTPTWPEQWPISRIAKVRRRLPPLSFARMYMCLPIDDEARRFERSWFVEAKHRAIKAGAVYQPAEIPVDPDTHRPWQVYVGVDLSSGRRGRQQRKADSSSLFTIAYHPVRKIRRVLDVQVGQWRAPEIVSRMQALQRKYDPVFAVEDDATQLLFVDSNDLAGLRVVGLTTGGTKHDPVLGFEAMALTFHAGRWEIPANPLVLNAHDEPASHPNVEQWITDLDDYSPVTHTSDIAMAGWIADKASQLFSRSYFGIARRVRVSLA